MARRWANARRVRINRSYSVPELASLCDVHRNTIRNWIRDGLPTIDRQRPALIQGQTVKDYLRAKRNKRKRTCPPGTIYCFRCKDPRRPAGQTATLIIDRRGAGNITATCEECGTAMFRRCRVDALTSVMPGIEIQIQHMKQRLERMGSAR